MRRWLLGFWFVLQCLCATSSAQMSAAAAISITARLPGSVTLSFRSTPVSIPLSNDVQPSFAVPLTVQWNLDPRETSGFVVEAYFRDPQAALAEESSAARVPAEDVMARWGQTSFQSFQSGRMRLFQTSVSNELRRGRESQILEVMMSERAASLFPKGQYEGVLYLEVRNY